jgi:hypothetical protein
MQHDLVDDGIAAVDGFRPVADHGHGGEAWDAGPLQVPDRRPPEVVREQLMAR